MTAGDFDSLVAACRGATLPPDVNWSRLIESASTAGLTAPLYESLRDSAGAPTAALREIGEMRMRQVQRSLALSGELFKALDRLAEAGIEAIAFKGPVIAVLAHADLAARWFNDVDLLVRRDQWERARAVLMRAGYMPTDELSAGAQRICDRFHGEIELGREPGVRIDLHWRFAPAYFFQLRVDERLWSEAQMVTLAGREVMTMSTAHTLVAAALEALKHGWVSLEWAVTIDRLVRSTDVDWSRVAAIAADAHATRSVSAALLLTRRLFLTPLPAAVVSTIESDRGAMRLAIAAEQAVSGGPEQFTWRMHLLAAPRSRDRLRYLLGLMLIPNLADLLWLKLPEPASPVYYAVKPIRLISKYVRLAHRASAAG